MSTTQLNTLFTQLINLPAETECVEFKEAKQSYDFGKLGKYFSALSNEANLKGKTSAWLIFGVKDKPIPRTIVGSEFRLNRADLDSLKAEVANKTTNRITFNEIYELTFAQGRVVLFDIPAAPKGFPVAWEGHYYGRDGEDISPLNLVEIEQIRSPATRFDWSAQLIPQASIADLDDKAIAVARDNYKTKFPHLAQEIEEWDTLTFLNKAKVTIGGQITNAAIILLGRSESDHFISPAQAKITWILKDHEGTEIDYEHFDAPLLLGVEGAFSKIRNLKYRYLKSKSLFPEEVMMYDAYVIREALHNCIAHQDYSLAGRVIVVEFPKRLFFSNEGDFIPENVSEVLHRNSPDTYSRNKFLTNAMFNLNMIDTIGSGIKRMFSKQKDRYFPLPEYRIKKSTVSVEIHGEILSLDYADYLANHKEMSLDEVIVLDKAQKGKELTVQDVAFLEGIGFSLDKKGKAKRVRVTKKSDQVLVTSDQESNQVTEKSDQVLGTSVEVIKKSNQVSDQVTKKSDQVKDNSDQVLVTNNQISENSDQVLVTNNAMQLKIIKFCYSPKTRKEILDEHLGLTNHTTNYKKYIEPLLDLNLLSKTIPNKSNSPFQKYLTTEKGRKLIG
jgi:ATP-dependent DNA helicase RecG